jgi:hypothetical protein
MAIADDDRLSAMTTRLEPIEISAHPEGAIVSIRAVVQLPSGPIPSPEEFRENCQAGTDQLLQAIPKLISALFHWLSQLESESPKLGHSQDGQLGKLPGGVPSSPPVLVGAD